jgi:hypothetical protein
VAPGAINFPLGHMVFMDKGDIFIFGQDGGLIVAVVAPFFRGVSFALDDIPVAFLTRDVAGPDKILMIESKSLELNVLFGILVAGDTIAQGKNPLLSFRMFEVTEETGAFGHLDVRAHDDLGVAARAA